MHWKNQYWHSYNDFLTHHFGEKVYKITVNAGFTCPTRDGTKGTQGCAFCDERGSSSFFGAGKAGQAIEQQILQSIPHVKKRYRVNKFIAYFQSFTNTYGPISYLQEIYDGALNIPDIVGLAIGTRPDCVPTPVLTLLNRYAQSRYVCLELGLQSLQDESLKFYARGHSAQEGIDAVCRAVKFTNLHIAVHLMFGAPGETIQDAIDAAKTLNKLGIHGVKIHQLMVLKNTLLENRYASLPWPLFSLDEYNELVMTFLEYLDPKIHVERTHATASHPGELIGPSWSKLRFEPLNRLRKQMQENKSFHGKKATPTT